MALSLNAAFHIRFCFALLGHSLIIFGAAGTFNYPHAWSYALLYFSASYWVGQYFLRRDPAFIRSRLNWREASPLQRFYIGILMICWFSGFLVAGFDFRFSWSELPSLLVLVGHVLALGGLWMVFQVFRQNRFASRLIEIQKDQRVISTGLYAWVRHPMYSAVIPVAVGTSLALGSWWALIPFGLSLGVLVLRLLDEEKFLGKNLPGYQQYCEKTRYRLIPFVW